MKNSYKLIILILILLICLYLSLFVGYSTFSKNPNLFFDLSNETNKTILNLLRIPRTIKAFIAGGCLSIAGMFIQALSKNPLAEPYLTGISSGAALGIILSIMLFSGTNYSLFGFIGALFTSLLVISISGFNRYSIAKLILIGLSLNVFVGAIISLITLLNPEKSYTMMLILSGGITDSEAIPIKSLVIMFSLLMISCVYVIPKLNLFRLDENLILISKKRKIIFSILTLLIASFLTSISVFTAGILGFVGIIIPQISRILFGYDYRWLVASNLILGASFLILCDFLARFLAYPIQIPLGLVIAFIGAPIFVFFLTNKRGLFND